MATFISGLAALNSYEGPRDSTKVPEVNERGIAAFRSSLHDTIEFTQLGEGLRSVSREAVIAEVQAHRGHLFEQFMSLGYSLWNSDEAEVHTIPFEGGLILMVDRVFHVRFLGNYCDSKLVELRDVEGHYTRPRFPAKGQIGYDCAFDRAMLDIPADPQEVLKALASARTAPSGVSFSYVVFPNSATPLVKETRRSEDGCTAEYLTMRPDMNTCNGIRYTIDDSGLQTCCHAADCQHSAEFYFRTFMDALSLRDPKGARRFIKPGASLTIEGNVVDEPLVLRPNASDNDLRQLLRRGPGWAGGDAAQCEQDEDGGPVAICRFGGGGTYFEARLERAGDGERWFVRSLRGEEH